MQAGWSWDGSYYWIRLTDQSAAEWQRRSALELRTELAKIQELEITQLSRRRSKR
jgi:hypothetical protein